MFSTRLLVLGSTICDNPTAKSEILLFSIEFQEAPSAPRGLAGSFLKINKPKFYSFQIYCFRDDHSEMIDF